MIDLKRLQELKLHTIPRWQIALGNTYFLLDYNFPRKTDIVLEGYEHIPKGRPVIFVMNHPDRYSYFPFMYGLFRRHHPFFCAVWIKGKYYQNPIMGFFFDHVNGIPLPSRGYLIVLDFKRTLKRKPNEREYRLLRRWVNGEIGGEEFREQATPELRKLAFTPHGDFDPVAEEYAGYLVRLYQEMMALVLKHSEDALLHKSLNLIVFPEGTRSIRLQKARNGVAQLALYLKDVPIVPVGGNGSEKCYPGALPISKGCRILYRVGEPMLPDGELRRFAIDEPFMPFTVEAERKHREKFDGLAELITRRINDLLDPEYRMQGEGEAKKDIGRFL